MLFHKAAAFGRFGRIMRFNQKTGILWGNDYG